LTDKKYWLKTIRKHLDNYPLEQLQAMYGVAIKGHLADDLSLYTPDSISSKLVETYQVVKAHFLAKQSQKEAIAHAVSQDAYKPTENEILQDKVETTLNWAKGKDGSVKNSKIMWRGIIFKSESDKELVLNYYSQWDKHINHETENDMRGLLEKGELLLHSALPMTDLTDLFHFRTDDEDKKLFQAFIFTQRATDPKFKAMTYRRQKSIPLADDLETCQLPEFYQDLMTPTHKFLIETGQNRLNELVPIGGN
jgi:hypothetical protein